MYMNLMISTIEKLTVHINHARPSMYYINFIPALSIV